MAGFVAIGSCRYKKAGYKASGSLLIAFFFSYKQKDFAPRAPSSSIQAMY
jgi:hypothetical protein